MTRSAGSSQPSRRRSSKRAVAADIKSPLISKRNASWRESAPRRSSSTTSPRWRADDHPAVGIQSQLRRFRKTEIEKSVEWIRLQIERLRITQAAKPPVVFDKP